MLNYNKGNRMDSLTEMNTETSPVLSTETPVKRGRGRPAKYSPEEREQKYKESTKKWHKEHIEDRTSYLKDYQERSRTALKLLAEMWDQGIIVINSENYEGKVRNLLENRQKVLV
jgi:hypothetical protein